jgi:DNA-binding CsgD family transcriptional regulator
MARAGNHARKGSLLIRPLGLAATQWELGAAAAFCAALIAVLVIEMLTPNDVVGSVGFLPLIAAMWTLSPRVAGVVALVAAVVFCVVLASEVGNRTTVVLIGCVGLVLAVLVRLYATRLETLLPITRQLPILSFPTLDTIDSLTRRELEVATLASRGLTAGEIAGQLHISQRTVESHLANAYAKLAIHSRAALRQLID